MKLKMTYLEGIQKLLAEDSFTSFYGNDQPY